jgi:uncharacterized protein
MSLRSLLRGLFWFVVTLALVFHLGGGWYFSGVLIEDAFIPEPDPIVTPSGDFELQEVAYQSELGDMTAWYLPASGDTWVIHVHGLGASPDEAQHLFAPLQEAGYPQLAITYRNDEGQPPDPSGFYQYGATEWADLAGAMDYAAVNGARSVVLSGFSSGASHVLAFLYRHNLDEIKGLILDSPNIDLGDTVDFAASRRDLPVLPFNVPPTVSATAKFITSLRMGVNWKSLDYLGRAETSLRIPVLVHHGSEDERVPVTQSEALAEASPDLVRLVTVEGAGHVDSYEADPEAYLAAVLGFLRQIG